MGNVSCKKLGKQESFHFSIIKNFLLKEPYTEE